MKKHGSQLQSKRSAFTLIELSIVIVIILILIALLLPAINGALKRGKETQQVNEISQLSLALESFKEKYGVYPPSRIRLRENSVYHLNSGHDDYEIDSSSVQYLTRIFPNIKLPVDTTSTAYTNVAQSATAQFDWFHDGVDTTYDLEGDECLVFFLAGIADSVSSPGTIIFHGFARDPSNPSGIPLASSPLSLSREQPLFTFDAGRLFIRSGQGEVDPPVPLTGPTADLTDFRIKTPTYNNGNNGRTTKLPSYRSIISPNGNNKAVAYFSSYEGRGYKPHDCNIPDKFQDEKTLDYFQVTWPQISTSTSGTPKHSLVSRGPNPYLEIDPVHLSDGTIVNPVNTLAKAFKADGFQLITAGTDGLYGVGGILRGNSFSTSDPDYDNFSNVGDGRSIGTFSSGLK